MLESLQTNSTISHYRILQKLGAGGMGEVYLAQDTKLDRKVALKILPADVAADQTRMRRFVQEAKAASALNHPNIITIHEIEQIVSMNFIATEFIDGETLRQRMRHTPMKLGEVLDVAIQCASALSAAHATGIVHRDIKPENIMIRRDGIVKVLDFGLAKLTEQLPLESVDTEAPTSLKTNPGTVVGTAVYMSPEQACGTEMDARTDIFSLGIVLYEMVAGRLPFDGSSSTEVLASILSEKEPLPLARYSTEVPVELERIVSKALRKNREERYQTIKDVLLDLQSLKQELEFQRKLERSLPPHLKSADTGEQAVETVMRSSARSTVDERGPTSGIELNKTRVVIAVAALLIIALGVGAYLYFMRSRSGAINSIAVLPLVNAGNNPDTEYLSDGISESLINSLTELQQLRVIARATAFRYKGKEIDPQAVGRELDVHAVLMGRVRQTGDTLNVQVDLVETSTGAQLWGEEYERGVSDLLLVKQAIAKRVTEKLKLRLSGEQQQKLVKRDTTNTESFRSYLRGRYYWNKRTPENIRKAIVEFQQAIDRDPSFALAYTGLADCYLLSTPDAENSESELYGKARAYAERALQIDDSLAEAHTSLAGINSFSWHWAEAEKEFRLALEQNANYPTAHHWQGIYFSDTGRYEEALVSLKRAQELDPLSRVISFALALTYLAKGEPVPALEVSEKIIELDPGYYGGYAARGQAYLKQGRYPEAVADIKKAVDLSEDDSQMLSWLGYTYAVSGRRSEAMSVIKVLEEKYRRNSSGGTEIAAVYLGLAERDQVFLWLEKDMKALQRRSLSEIVRTPLFHSLRGDPRYDRLLQRMGLAPLK